MLLNSVIIVLREVLEAALIFSILLALSKQSGIQRTWILWSLIFGTVGAVIYGTNIPLVSDWFDGVGQEVSNAIIQYAVYIMLLGYIILLLNFNYRKKIILQRMLIIIMIFITSTAMIREGAEILLYYLSVTRSQNHYAAVIMGMTIGVSIGVSIGFLFYYLLVNISEKWAMSFGLGLLILVSSGMISQATLLMIQADWLPAQMPLWNTTQWLSEKSVLGQLLYALLGYEATPTAIQASMYLSGLILPVIIILILRRSLLRNASNE